MKSKRYKKLPENAKLKKPDSINNLIPIIKKNCTTKFDESIDLSILINCYSISVTIYGQSQLPENLMIISTKMNFF